MEGTRNSYSYPLKISDNVEITYDKSSAHRGRLSNAVDFIVPSGTPIKAALDGIVVDVKEDSDIGGDEEILDQFGNYIEIKHDNEEYSIYEHVKKSGSLVKKGDAVTQGQVIGYSGSTGFLAGLGPHIHFDVHKYFGTGPEDYKSLKINWNSKTEKSKKG